MASVIFKNAAGTVVREIPLGADSASEVGYDNTTSGLSADNTQDAIDEIAANSGGSFSSDDADLLKDILYMGEYSTAERAIEARDKIDALITSLKSLRVTSISVTYSGGSVVEGTSVSELTGIVVTATYSDESTAVVEAYTMSPSTIAVGTNTITVTYRGKTASFTVTGNAKPVASISAVYSGGSVVEGTSAEDLRDDIVVTATYEDSTSAVVTGWTISGTVVVGTNDFAITYGGKSTTITVTGTEIPKPNLLETAAVRSINAAYFGYYNNGLKYTARGDWGTAYIVPVEAGKTYRFTWYTTASSHHNQFFFNTNAISTYAGKTESDAMYNIGTWDGDYSAINTSSWTSGTSYIVKSTSAITSVLEDNTYRKYMDIEYTHDGYAMFSMGTTSAVISYKLTEV